MSQIIIIPYFCEDEVTRYLKIADRFEAFKKQETEYEFLLASSPRTCPSRRLYDRFSKIAPTSIFECPSQIFGYPQGPTAMFWDCMDYIGQATPHDGGFSLWFESDMIPIAPDWLDRLTAEWNSQTPSPLLMGRLVPTLGKNRIFRKRKVWVTEHINGGGCYSKDFSLQVPTEAREGVFDVIVYDYVSKLGRAVASSAIGFSTVERLPIEMAKPERVLLHGFMQDKDEFIDTCVAIDRESLTPHAPKTGIAGSIDRAYQKFRLQFVVHGKEAVLTALYQKQDEDEGVYRRSA